MSTQSKLQIGIVVDCLGLPIREGIAKAAEIGADGIQVWVTSGEMLASNMGPAQRKDFTKSCDNLGLTISAVCVEFGPGLRDPAQAAELMPKLKAAFEQAADIGAPVATAHLGGCVGSSSDPAYDGWRRAINEVGRYAKSCGIRFAMETGSESGPVMRQVLDSLDTDGLGVNFDPANFVMSGFDHMEAARELAPYVVHSHAKDGRRGVGELPLGEGDVNFPDYIALWRSLGYNGFFTIEREVGEDRVGDMTRAVEFLRQL